MSKIAELCGVSRGTVDRVLHNRGRVSEKTVEKVRRVADELGYKPNSLGKALASVRKTLKIGVILCSAENPFFDDIEKGIKAAEKENAMYNVEILYRQFVGYDVETELNIIDELEPQIDALVLVPIDHVSISEKIDALVENGIIVITINTDMPTSKRLFYVGANAVECGRMACGLLGLLSSGAPWRVLMTITSHSLQEHNCRIDGFTQMMNERHTNLNLVDIVETQDSAQLAKLAVDKVLQREHVDAIFVSCGGAKGVCESLAQYSATDVCVIACDCIPDVQKLIRENRIKATICQQPWEQGYQSICKVVQLLTVGKYDNMHEIKNEILLYENLI